MAEKSILWAAPTSGDGAAAYTEDETTRLFRLLTGNVPASEGVIYNPTDGKLAVSGSASPLTVSDGAALVNGYFYWNTAALNVTVPTPSVGVTGKRVVLQLINASKTIRVALLTSSDGVASIPALTQTPGTKWEISLATLTITTGGVITLTDDRSFCHFGTKVNNGMIDNDIVDDTKAGNRVPQFYRRQGGNATNWNAPGSTDYTPTAVRMQRGAMTLEILSGNYSASVAITFPVAFSVVPSILPGIQGIAGTVDGISFFVYTSNITAAGFTLIAARGTNPAAQNDVTLTWEATGTE